MGRSREILEIRASDALREGFRMALHDRLEIVFFREGIRAAGKECRGERDHGKHPEVHVGKVRK